MADLVHTTAAVPGAASAPAADPLTALQETPLPMPPAWTPQTWGWIVVAFLLLALLAWVAWLIYRHSLRNRYRKAALQELALIEQTLTQPPTPELAQRRGQALVALPMLVKRVVLAFAPRERVAALSEAQWLAFLDTTLPGAHFTQGEGKLLPALAYNPRPPADDELRRLIALLRLWIGRHHAPV